MHTTEKLAEVLEKRAIARLDADLLGIFHYVSQKLDITKGPNLKMMDHDGSDLPNIKPVSLYFILQYEKRPGYDFINRSPYMQELREALLPVYRDRVIKEFMDKVDKMDLQEQEEE